MKTNKLFLSMLMFSSALLFTSCQGEQGDLGPQGEVGEHGVTGAQGEQGESGQDGQDGQDATTLIEAGSVSGTVEGTRKDGTAFSEPFSYNFKYEGDTEGFVNKGSFHQLQLYRNDGALSSANYVGPGFTVFNKGSANMNLDIWYIWFSMEKDLGDNKLFKLSHGFEQRELNVVYPMDRSDVTYGFLEGGIDYTTNWYSNPREHSFSIDDGSIVVFEYEYTNSDVNGMFGNFLRKENPDGTVESTGTIYNNLILRPGMKFFTRDTNTDRSETIIVPADEYSISNLQYDPATGHLTFNMDMLIQGDRRNGNSTRNALNVNIAFDLTVYDEILNSAHQDKNHSSDL